MKKKRQNRVTGFTLPKIKVRDRKKRRETTAKRSVYCRCCFHKSPAFSSYRFKQAFRVFRFLFFYHFFFNSSWIRSGRQEIYSSSAGIYYALWTATLFLRKFLYLFFYFHFSVTTSTYLLIGCCLVVAVLYVLLPKLVSEGLVNGQICEFGCFQNLD